MSNDKRCDIYLANDMTRHGNGEVDKRPRVNKASNFVGFMAYTEHHMTCDDLGLNNMGPSVYYLSTVIEFCVILHRKIIFIDSTKLNYRIIRQSNSQPQRRGP